MNDGFPIHDEFRQAFGSEPTHVAVAPGRVNLIGEHTDYNEGFVFPAAIDLELTVAARAIGGPSQVASAQRGVAVPFDVGLLHSTTSHGWAKYAAGMAWVLGQHGFEDLPNIQAFVKSTIPIASGVSSSAAMEMAFGVLWNALAGLGLTNKELALFAQEAENRFVGVKCGIMDMMASAMGRAGHAMFLDTRSLEIDYAKIPDGLQLVICHTGKRRGLLDSVYNERREQCEEAARALGVPALRDATVEDVERLRDRAPEAVYLRARHVATENERCSAFSEALEVGDLACAGRLMRASHVSLRDDFDVSCLELDTMAESAWVAPGCVGARMTGAGFGGVCVALVKAGAVDEFIATTDVGYRKTCVLTPTFIACQASDGARLALGP